MKIIRNTMSQIEDKISICFLYCSILCRVEYNWQVRWFHFSKWRCSSDDYQHHVEVISYKKIKIIIASCIEFVNPNFIYLLFGNIGLILWHDIALFKISMCVHNHYTFVRFHFTRIKIEGGIEMFSNNSHGWSLPLSLFDVSFML